MLKKDSHVTYSLFIESLTSDKDGVSLLLCVLTSNAESANKADVSEVLMEEDKLLLLCFFAASRNV